MMRAATRGLADFGSLLEWGSRSVATWQREAEASQVRAARRRRLEAERARRRARRHEVARQYAAIWLAAALFVLAMYLLAVVFGA